MRMGQCEKGEGVTQSQESVLTNWQTPAWTEDTSRKDTHVMGKTKSASSCSMPGGQWWLRGTKRRAGTRKHETTAIFLFCNGQYSILSVLGRSLKEKKVVSIFFATKKGELH